MPKEAELRCGYCKFWMLELEERPANLSINDGAMPESLAIATGQCQMKNIRPTLGIAKCRVLDRNGEVLFEEVRS